MIDYWFMEMDYSERHCYGPNKDGLYTRNGASFLDKYPYCADWYKHPFKAGNTFFIRWIRNFGSLTEGIVTGFPEGTLALGNQKMPDSDTVMYCENYQDKVLAFLDPYKSGKAYVYVVPEFKDEARRAVELTNEEYRDMLAKVPYKVEA